MDLKNDFNRLR